MKTLGGLTSEDKLSVSMQSYLMFCFVNLLYFAVRSKWIYNMLSLQNCFWKPPNSLSKCFVKAWAIQNFTKISI